jgi:hypothetical protein
MKALLKMVSASGLLCLLLVVSGVAQITDGMDFSTDFPFWVGTTKLPAGSYTITQPTQMQGTMRVSDASGKPTAMVEFTPMQVETPHASSDVIFHRYGTGEYLNSVWCGSEVRFEG